LENPNDGTGENHLERSHPLQKEEWPWDITPIAKRKLAMVHHAHCEKETWALYITPIAKSRMAMVHHTHFKKKNGHGTSRPLRKGKMATPGPKDNQKITKSGAKKSSASHNGGKESRYSHLERR
jgi:hypothetical protein